MSVNITGPALSSLLFEHCNADGDREGFLLGKVTNVVTNTISDADINVIKHQIVYNIYSFLPVYGSSRWYDRKGAVDENAFIKILQDVNLKEIIGWYKLRRNSSMQVSMREHAIHSHLSRWLQRNEDSHAALFMLCVSQSAANPALYTCDHVYMIASDISGYECLPESVISLAGVAEPSYKLSAACVSSEQCTYNRVLNKSSRDFVDASSDTTIVGNISRVSARLSQKLKALSGSVLDTEEQLGKELTELRCLRQQLEECQSHTGNQLDMTVLSAVLASSAEEKPLMKVSVDDKSLSTDLASNAEPILFGSDGAEDISFSQPLPDSNRDCKEDVMLLDTEDEAPPLQVPCLIPESVVPSITSQSQNDSHQTRSSPCIRADGTVDVHASSAMVDADIPNGSIQKPAESRPFDFVNDVMRSCSPNQSNKSTALPHLRSRTAAECDSLKSQGGQHTSGQTANNIGS